MEEEEEDDADVDGAGGLDGGKDTTAMLLETIIIKKHKDKGTNTQGRNTEDTSKHNTMYSLVALDDFPLSSPLLSLP